MGIVARLFEKRTATLAQPDSWITEVLGGGRTAAGVTVNHKTALTNSAVFNAIRIYAETIGSLPLILYHRLEPRGKERAREHHLYRLLHDAPNAEMTAMQFRETMQAHLVTWGNAYAYKVYDGAGRLIELWPLRPDKMTPTRLTESIRTEFGTKQPGELVYVYTLPDGEQRILPRESVWHIPGLGFDGVVGYSVITMARQSIGLALATEEFGARWFGEGGRPAGVLTHPQQLSDAARDRIRADWYRMHSGLERSHRIAILEEGVQWQQIGIPPEDSQFLQTRKFQVTEIARWFNLPPHILKDLDRSTNNNIEQQSIELVVYSFRPWFVRWEQSIKLHLLPQSEWDTYFAEFLIEGLLRGDIESRYRAYAMARQWGWMSANDVRELENMNPLPGNSGDIYLVPMNMMSAEMVAREQEQDVDDELSVRLARRELSQRAVTDSKELRSAQKRQRLQESFKPVIMDAAARIIRRERADIMREAERVFRRRSNAQAFVEWMGRFYENHPSFITQTMAPAFLALADAIWGEAQEELGAGLDRGALDGFVDDYMTTYAVRHAQESFGQLRRVVLDAEAAGDDIAAALSQRFDEWVERRPGKIAARETVRLGNAVTRLGYEQGGVTYLRWVATSGKSCPYCIELDGKVVGIKGSFANEGDTFHPAGVDSPLTVSSRINHPPLHDGCSCQIVPA